MEDDQFLNHENEELASDCLSSKILINDEANDPNDYDNNEYAQLLRREHWLNTKRIVHPFIDLSDEGLEGIKKEPGYYGFYVDHDPSKSISLFDSQNEFSCDNNMQNEDLCSVDSEQVKSAKYYCSKTEFYKQKEIHPPIELRKDDKFNYSENIKIVGQKISDENNSSNKLHDPEHSKISVKVSIIDKDDLLKEFKDEIFSKLDRETVVVEEANFNASLAIKHKLFTKTVIFENTEFCVHKEKGFECCMQNSYHRQAAKEQNESNNEERKSSGNSQPYSYYSASKSKESGSKPPIKESKKKRNSNPNEEPSGSSDSKSSHSEDSKSNHTQNVDYSEKYKEKNTENMEYVKAYKKAFKDEKEYRIFSQNTVNHSIIRYNKLIKKLYLNCLKTERMHLEEYIQRDNFIDLCFENVEIELDSLKDFQHRILMFYLDDCDIQNKNKIIFKSSNQKINEEIRLHLNAKNLYLFKSVILQMKGYHLELRNFEFYYLSEFADFISMTKNYSILTFKNCKIHTNKNLLFKENKKYPNQNISLRNCSYYLESDNKVKKSCFDEYGCFVPKPNQNHAKNLKKASYLRRNSLGNDSITHIPNKLISSKQYYFDATHKKRTRSCNCAHPTRSTLSSSESQSAPLE